jgi:hypothetical protein
MLLVVVVAAVSINCDLNGHVRSGRHVHLKLNRAD